MSAQKRRLPAMAGGATGRVNNSSASTGRGVEPGFRSAGGTILPFIFSCGMHARAWNIRSLLGEHAPSCTDEFRGKGDDQNIRMHPSRSCFEPSAKSMVRPSVLPHQDRSGASDEQRPQIAPRGSLDRRSVEIRLGTRPSHATESRPFAKASSVPIAAPMALDVIDPMPGRRGHQTSERAD
jgi:hypothetical protein